MSRRNSRGSILLLMSIITVFIICGLVFFSPLPGAMIRQRDDTHAMEAAAVYAAKDLSKIVIKDVYFGFVSISDQPATGRTTIAPDQQPTPVRGINTLEASARLDYEIGLRLGNLRMQSLALEDLGHIKEASTRLEKVLSKSLQGNCPEALDLNGDPVKPLADAAQAYCALAGTNPANFKLELGWTPEGGSTITPIPEPASKQSGISPQSVISGCYKAYVNIPVGTQDFSFAAVSRQAELVNGSHFLPADGKHICTTVRASANFKMKTGNVIEVTACAQPYALNVQPEPSVMVLGCPMGLPAGLKSIGDILTSPVLQGTRSFVSTVTGGDYPYDSQSRLVPSQSASTVSDEFAIGFYDWLRSNRALPKIDSVLSAVEMDLSKVPELAAANDPTRTRKTAAYAFIVSSSGEVVVAPVRRFGFDLKCVQDSQRFTHSYGLHVGNRAWTVNSRDEVRTIAGKHSGQPLPADTINWAELEAFVPNNFTQAARSRRPENLAFIGQPDQSGAIPLEGVRLASDGQLINFGLRASSYSPGLAFDTTIMMNMR